MGEPFEISYAKNKLAWIAMLIFSPVILYYDYNVYVINVIKLNAFQIGDIYLKLSLASIIGIILSLGITGLWYLSVSNDWDNYVKSRRSIKERIFDKKTNLRFLSLRFAMIPVAGIIAYLMSILIISPVTIFYFLFFGYFLLWSFVLKKKSLSTNQRKS